jgi:hypothetical protein
MGALTKAQRAELERLRDYKIPESFRRNGFPGQPYTVLDMRSIEALHKRGFVECIIHEWKADHMDKPSRMPCYRITEAGKAALAVPS